MPLCGRPTGSNSLVRKVGQLVHLPGTACLGSPTVRQALPAQTVDATLVCSLLASLEPQCLSGTLIQAQRDLVELRLRDGGQGAGRVDLEPEPAAALRREHHLS